MKKLLVLILVLVAPVVSSAGSSRVLPAAYNERTFGGAGRDYTDLATWESDTDTDLVTAGKGEVLTCYADSASYNQAVNLSGATASATLFRVIRAARGHRGTPTGGVRFVKSGSTSLIMFHIQENYGQIHDIATSITNALATSGAYAVGFSNDTGVLSAKFVGCTAYDINATGGSNTYGAGFRGAYRQAFFINCITTNINGTSYSSGGFSFTTGSGVGSIAHILYNCSVVGSSKGVSLYNSYVGSALTVSAKNCIAQDNTINTYSYGSYSMTLAEDPSIVSSGVTFAADGYHLGRGDSAAKNGGTDLSSDATFPFNDDIDGKTRRGAWDIGCDEISARTLPIVH